MAQGGGFPPFSLWQQTPPSSSRHFSARGGGSFVIGPPSLESHVRESGPPLARGEGGLVVGLFSLRFSSQSPPPPGRRPPPLLGLGLVIILYPLQFFHIRYCLKLREPLPPPPLFSPKQQTPPFSPSHFSARGGVVLRRRPLLPRILVAVHPPPPFSVWQQTPSPPPPSKPSWLSPEAHPRDRSGARSLFRRRPTRARGSRFTHPRMPESA